MDGTMKRFSSMQDGTGWDQSDPADRFDVAQLLRQINFDFEPDFEPLPEPLAGILRAD